MAAEQRKLLEQLMGEQLMNAPGTTSKQPQLAITDHKVCRSYLVGTCPHDLFTNTKQDLGPCSNVHSEALKTEYELADEQQKRRWAFEHDYMRHMYKYIDDCNRKIQGAQKHLEKTDEEIRKTNALLKQISDVNKSVDVGLQELRYLGESGSVQLGVTEHWKMRQYQQRKQDLERELRTLNDAGGPSGHQKLQVCDVCGAYLSRLDNDRRLADHFFGKMHLGYAQMRKKHEQLHKEMRGKPAPQREDNSHGPPSEDRFGQSGYDGGGRGGFGGGRGRGYRGGGYRGGGYRGRGNW